VYCGVLQNFRAYEKLALNNLEGRELITYNNKSYKTFAEMFITVRGSDDSIVFTIVAKFFFVFPLLPR